MGMEARVVLLVVLLVVVMGGHVDLRGGRLQGLVGNLGVLRGGTVLAVAPRGREERGSGRSGFVAEASQA